MRVASIDVFYDDAETPEIEVTTHESSASLDGFVTLRMGPLKAYLIPGAHLEALGRALTLAAVAIMSAPKSMPRPDAPITASSSEEPF